MRAEAVARGQGSLTPDELTDYSCRSALAQQIVAQHPHTPQETRDELTPLSTDAIRHSLAQLDNLRRRITGEERKRTDQASLC